MSNTPKKVTADNLSQQQLVKLVSYIKSQASDFGFQEVGIVAPDLAAAGDKLNHWLQKGYQGTMSYMAKHGGKRYQPRQLIPGTVRVICLGMHYFNPKITSISCLQDHRQGYVARYALGRDYHKLMRKRLAQLAKAIEDKVGTYDYRVFVDSAPVMEKPLAQQAGLGWQGKNTLLINRKRGSWMLLGEIFINLPLPVDSAYDKDHCSRCTACLDVCPTNAFPQPYVLDANRCIAYLTIENKGPIPPELRPLMGNRIFGCDDCQLVCPWNRVPATTQEPDFKPRHRLDQSQLIELFLWTAEEFNQHTLGSPIRRTGYHGWLRNIAVALGNGQATQATFAALQSRRHHPSELVQEHVQWAIDTLQYRQANSIPLTPVSTLGPKPIATFDQKKLAHLN